MSEREKSTLYTTSPEDIIESISDICNCSKDNINNYINRSRPFINLFAGDINLNQFFKAIGVPFSGNNELLEIIKFDSCVISHLTTRTSLADESDILCLIKVLSGATDISRFLASKEITFKETAEGLVTYYNNKIVDWKKFDSPFAYRMIKRLRIRGKYIDNCINGFLFNHLIWEDSNAEHIKDCPEIVTDICYVLNRQDILHEWRSISTSYTLGFLADVKDIIFDEHSRFKTTKSKIYLIYKYAVYYLVQLHHGVWNSRFDNPIIRLKDNCSISKDNIFGFYEIER